jgi:hypothetical protein
MKSWVQRYTWKVDPEFFTFAPNLSHAIRPTFLFWFVCYLWIFSKFCSVIRGGHHRESIAEYALVNAIEEFSNFGVERHSPFTGKNRSRFIAVCFWG